MSMSNNYPFAGTGQIGGQVFLDRDNDGIRDSVQPLPMSFNTLVTLHSCINSNGISNGNGISISNSNNSDSSSEEKQQQQQLGHTMIPIAGIYKFANLSPGRYYVGAEPPTGYEFSDTWSGSTNNENVNVDNNINIITNAGFPTRRRTRTRRRERTLGTGGIVNGGVIDYDVEKSRMNPDTGRTECFDLVEGERTMEWSFGLHSQQTQTQTQTTTLTDIDIDSGQPSYSPSMHSTIGVGSVDQSVMPSHAPSAHHVTGSPSYSYQPSMGPTVTTTTTSYPTTSLVPPPLVGNPSPNLPEDAPTTGTDNPTTTIYSRPSLNPTTALFRRTDNPTKQHDRPTLFSNNPADAQNPSLAPSISIVATSSTGEGGEMTEYQADSSISGTTNNAAGNATGGSGNGNANTTAIIGIVCGMVALLALVAAGLFVHRTRRKNSDGGVVPETVTATRGGSGYDHHSSLTPASDHLVAEVGRGPIGAPEEEEAPPLRSLSYPPYQKTNLSKKSKKSSGISSLASISSGQGTHYSAGGASSQSPSQSVPQAPTKSNLSPSSSLNAAEGQRITIAMLEKEVSSLSIAVQQFGKNSPPWLLLNKNLDRAREELDAVQQDVEMGSPSLLGGPVTASVDSACVPNSAIVSAMRNEGAFKEDDNIPHSSDQSTSPTRTTRSQGEGGSYSSSRSGSSSSEPEVWILCSKNNEEDSLDNSLVTFDEWSVMDGASAKPDPAGCTKYVTAGRPLKSITENGEATEEEMGENNEKIYERKENDAVGRSADAKLPETEIIPSKPKTKKLDNALQSSNEALKLHGTNVKVLYRRAQCLYQKRKFDDAVKDLKEAEKLAPEDKAVKKLRWLVDQQMAK